MLAKEAPSPHGSWPRKEKEEVFLIGAVDHKEEEGEGRRRKVGMIFVRGFSVVLVVFKGNDGFHAKFDSL